MERFIKERERDNLRDRTEGYVCECDDSFIISYSGHSWFHGRFGPVGSKDCLRAIEEEYAV